LNDKDYDDFDTYVSKKGYEYATSLNDEISESRFYNFKRESSNNKAKYWIRYFRYFEGQTNAKTNISWQTARQNDYVLIKDQTKSSGFKPVETGNYEETIYSTYQKGKIEVQPYSGNTKNGFGDITSTYEINVSILR